MCSVGGTTELNVLFMFWQYACRSKNSHHPHDRESRPSGLSVLKHLGKRVRFVEPKYQMGSLLSITMKDRPAGNGTNGSTGSDRWATGSTGAAPTEVKARTHVPESPCGRMPWGKDWSLQSGGGGGQAQHEPSKRKQLQLKEAP